MSGQPVVLTVDGRPEMVVQDAAAYKKMAEKLEYWETVEGIKRGISQAEAGLAVPFEEFEREFRKRHNMPARK